MTKTEYMEQVCKAAGLQYDLWGKFPAYVHLDVTLSTDRQGKDGVDFNIYTPELNHNRYGNFNDFVRFMDLCIKDGVAKVRKRILEDRLNGAKELRDNAADTIYDTQKELDKLLGETNDSC